MEGALSQNPGAFNIVPGLSTTDQDSHTVETDLIEDSDSVINWITGKIEGDDAQRVGDFLNSNNNEIMNRLWVILKIAQSIEERESQRSLVAKPALRPDFFEHMRAIGNET